MTTLQNSPDAGTLRAWLVQKVAEFTAREPAGIDPAASLAELGLDSVYALALCGEIEDHLDRQLEPTIIWDYPSIDALTAYLCADRPDAGS